MDGIVYRSEDTGQRSQTHRRRVEGILCLPWKIACCYEVVRNDMTPGTTAPARAETKPTSRNPWLWVPSLYFSEGIPYVIVMTMSVVMYKRLGISNTDIALDVYKRQGPGRLREAADL